jgi:heat shock protein HtpX
MLKANGLYGYVQNNNLKSTVLILSYLIIGQLLGFSLAMFYALNFVPGDAAAKFSQAVWFAWRDSGIFLVGSLLWAAGAFGLYKTMVRRATGAKPVTRSQEFRLYNRVETLAIAAGLPMPAVEVIETSSLNAYAMGLTPGSASITFTRGLLKMLNDDELDAVIAHELAHIGNLDIRLITFATICTGITFSIVSYIFSKLMPKLSMKRPTAGLILAFVLGYRFPIVFLGALVSFAVIAAIGALLLKFAISRTREFVADASAVELTKNPAALVAALRKISGRDQLPEIDMTIDAMLISSSATSWFATHPSIEDRLAAIEFYAPNFVPQPAAFGQFNSASVRYATAGEASGLDFFSEFTYPSWVSATRIVLPVVVICYALHGVFVSGEGLKFPDIRQIVMPMMINSNDPAAVSDYAKKMTAYTQSENGKPSMAEQCRTVVDGGKKRVLPKGMFISRADSPNDPEVCGQLSMWEVFDFSVMAPELFRNFAIFLPFIVLAWWRKRKGLPQLTRGNIVTEFFGGGRTSESEDPEPDDRFARADLAIARRSEELRSQSQPANAVHKPMFGRAN